MSRGRRGLRYKQVGRFVLIGVLHHLPALVALTCAGLPQPDTLHDTEAPVLDPGQQVTARAYAQAQIEALRGYLGW